MEDREVFLGSLDQPWLVLTETGGIGKTTALEQLGYLRSVLSSGHLCLRVEAAELPELAEGYLGVDAAAAESVTPPLLVWKFREETGDSSLSGVEIWRLLQRKIRRCELSLLVDALDQIDLSPDARSTRQMRGLASFLTQHAAAIDSTCDIHCVVTGRPYAVSHHWRELSRVGDWRIAAVAPFSEEEQKTYLTEKRWKLLKQLEANVMSIPRALERLRELEDRDLAKLCTAADVYRESIRRVLTKGLEKQATDLDEAEAIQWFALLAFEMLRQGRFVDVAAGAEFDAFLESLLNNRREWLGNECGIDTLQKLRQKLTALNRLNIAMDNAVTETRRLTCIRWHDRTLQDFFAAVWCARYAEDTDQRWLIDHKQVTGITEAETYAEFWRLVCGMPRFSLRGDPNHDVFDDRRWVEAVTVCYEEEGGRSTEMIYRSWPRLLEIADYSKDETGSAPLPAMPSESQVGDFNVKLEGWVKGRVDLGELAAAADTPVPGTAKAAARRIIEQYLSEFLRLLLEEGDTDPQRIAREFHVDWFDTTTIEPGLFAMGDDQYGDQPKHEDHIKTPYRMSKYPLTNELVNLFDPERASRFDDYTDVRPEDRCPAIYCTWYDAWALALWLHAQLPTEQEWECVCRGKAKEHRTEHLAYGWFEDESELGANAWCRKSDGQQYAMIQIDGTWKGAVPEKDRTPYGVAHLLGQVREWTSSVWCEDPREAPPAHAGSSRVLRGGSFRRNTDYCRAAFRCGYRPVGSRTGVGVRLVRRG